MQLGGSWLLPMQSSHVSQGLMQPGVWMHGAHFVGSVSEPESQVPGLPA